MKVVEKLVAFYGALLAIIKDEQFVESSAEAAVKLFGEVGSAVSFEDVTVDYLRKVHEGYRSFSGENGDLLNDLVEGAFQDLAKHLRIPKVRALMDDLMGMVDADKEDLFIRTMNVRRLSDDPDGPAVVTVVVHNYGKLKGFLEEPDTVPFIRHSDQTEE